VISPLLSRFRRASPEVLTVRPGRRRMEEGRGCTRT
jgi:hypothetical protein